MDGVANGKATYKTQDEVAWSLDGCLLRSRSVLSLSTLCAAPPPPRVLRD